jgi:hypothetical protein
MAVAPGPATADEQAVLLLAAPLGDGAPTLPPAAFELSDADVHVVTIPPGCDHIGLLVDGCEAPGFDAALEACPLPRVHRHADEQRSTAAPADGGSREGLGHVEENAGRGGSM